MAMGFFDIVIIISSSTRAITVHKAGSQIKIHDVGCLILYMLLFTANMISSYKNDNLNVEFSTPALDAGAGIQYLNLKI